MRRFFISNLERLLNILTVLAGLALLAWAILLGQQAQGDLVQLLMAAAVFLGGLVAIVALTGCAMLALSIHDNTRRIALKLERPLAAKPMRASRNSESARMAPAAAPAPQPSEQHMAAPTRPAPEAVKPAPPKHQAAPQSSTVPNRPMFSGMSMHKTPAVKAAPLLREPQAADHAPASPTLRSAPVPDQRMSSGPKLVADRRMPR